MAKRRKKYPLKKKISFLKRHLVDKVPVSDLCDQHGLFSTIFLPYGARWKLETAFTEIKQKTKFRLPK